MHTILKLLSLYLVTLLLAFGPNTLQAKKTDGTGYFFSNPSLDVITANVDYNPPSVIDDREKAQEAFTVIDTHDSWVDNFSNENIMELPIGIKKTVDNVQYAIGIISAKITPTYTELTVFGRLIINQTDAQGEPFQLFFGANNVRLSHQGGIIGDAKLVLLGDFNIPFNDGKWLITLNGGFNYTTGNVQDKTYIIINCDGVSDIALKGAVELSRDLVLPLETDGTVNENKTTVSKTVINENGTSVFQVPYRVKGEFDISATDWNDILVSINLSPFTLKEKRNGSNYNSNFLFYSNNAVFDFSDLRNDSSVTFPGYYTENGLLLPNANTWRGIFVSSLDVKMPAEFKTKSSTAQSDRVSFGAQNLIIDNHGISGNFDADNIFSITQGKTASQNAWAYSMDHLEIKLAASTLVEAKFNGKIVLPINKVDENSDPNLVGLKYSGVMSENEYSLTVKNDSIINVNLWSAKATLNPNSFVELKVVQGEFKPRAVLNGKLTILANPIDFNTGGAAATAANTGSGATSTAAATPENSDAAVNFKDIIFQNLNLRSVAPFLTVQSMGNGSNMKLAKFPINISNVSIEDTNGMANLKFDLALNLMGGNNGFSAVGSLKILGKYMQDTGIQSWAYQGLQLDALNVDADFQAIKFQGSLKMLRDDPVYGNGFKASVNASFESLDFAVTANAIFGNTTYRYWMVDASVNLPTAAIPHTFTVTGFAGGASYKMKKQDIAANIDTGAFTYEPDDTYGLGIKAMVLFNIASDKVMKGGAGFEALFNSTGGLNQIVLYGKGAAMTQTIPGMASITDALNKFRANATAKAKLLGLTNETIQNSYVGSALLAKADTDMFEVTTSDVTILAKMGISYDFQNKILHGTLDMFVNTPGGIFQGTGPNGRAGWAVLHVAPDDWYFHIGTPQDRIGLKLAVGPVSVNTGSYLMVGQTMPAAPPPPANVASLLGTSADALNYMRDENALESGQGFAFGSNISVDTGDLTFLSFYAQYQAGIGFDIMMKKYANAVCSNTGSQIGFNGGWFANGQVYSYMQGELGLRVELFGVKKKVPIIQGSGALLLQAKLPNPVWMKGYLAGNYNVLNGLLKGSFNFKVTVGEECEISNSNPMGGLEMISDVSPQNNDDEVDVFSIPQATFAFAVNQPINIQDDAGNSTYRIKLDEFKLLHNGSEVPGTINWNSANDKVNFVSTDILPPNQPMTLSVKVSFESKVNGIFQPLIVDGQPAKEERLISFTTGEAPSVIPLQNIEYAYPVLDQKHFYENEYNQGYIQLQRGQDYLFDMANWNTNVSFTDASNNKLNAQFNYDSANNVVSYSLPDVNQSQNYHIAIVSSPVQQSSSSNSQPEYSNVDLGNNNDGNTVEVRNNTAQAGLKEGEIERLAYDFSTSQYTSFSQKISTINNTQYNWGYVSSATIYLYNQIASHEPFEIAELTGNQYTDDEPLVVASAVLNDAYFTVDLNPYLYGPFPFSTNHQIQNRDVTVYGFPPVKALKLSTAYLTNLNYNTNPTMLQTTFPYQYNLVPIYNDDWNEMYTKISMDYATNPSAVSTQGIQFLQQNFLFMRSGFYPVQLQYKLPGGINGSSGTYQFKNPLTFR